MEWPDDRKKEFNDDKTCPCNGMVDRFVDFLSPGAQRLPCLPVCPQDFPWHKSYGGSGEESHPHYVIQTKDTGFIMVGETGFIEDRSARILAVKTDRTGELLWKREFGERGHNLGNCVSETPDGNYLIAGSLNLDAALIKVDASTGKTLWSKTWNLGTEDAFEGLTVTPNGGILATGYKNGLAEGTFLNWEKEFCSNQFRRKGRMES